MNDLLAQWLPGLQAMVNIHPLMVHFPVALIYGFVLADALAWLLRRESLRHAAGWMLYFGTLGAAVTVVTGLLAAATVEHDEEVHAIMALHESYGLGVLCVAVVLSLWRALVRGRFSRWGHAIHILAGLALAALVTLGADLGGMMVYQHGVGRVPSRAADLSARPDCPPAPADAGEAGGSATVPAIDPPGQAPASPDGLQSEHHHAHPHKHSHRHPHTH